MASTEATPNADVSAATPNADVSVAMSNADVSAATPNADVSAATPNADVSVAMSVTNDGPTSLARRLHPLGWVAGGLLIVAALYHTVLDTKYLIGNLAGWQWAALVAVVVLAAVPEVLHRLRIGLEKIGTFSRWAAITLAWAVFFIQLFNVITRYANPLVEQDILIGQMTSAAWQAFGLLFLLGISFGVRDGVNPRIDFWWHKLAAKPKAWLDFVLHTLLLLPFTWMAIRILQPYTEISLGRKRDGTWPEGFRVWETWEQSSDADQLPVGPIKAMILVAFVLFALQIIAQLIKDGFVIMGRDDLVQTKESDAPMRIE